MAHTLFSGNLSGQGRFELSPVRPESCPRRVLALVLPGLQKPGTRAEHTPRATVRAQLAEFKLAAQVTLRRLPRKI